MATRRETLCGHRRRGAVLIDMESVYRKVDKGMKLKDIADDLGVCVSTLQKRHKKYQEQLDRLEARGIDIADINASNIEEYLTEIDVPKSGTRDKSLECENVYPELPEEYL